MNYTFVKIQNKKVPMLDYPYALLCDNVNVLLEYENKFGAASRLKIGLEDIIQNSHTHLNTDHGSLIRMTARFKRVNILDAASQILTEVLTKKAIYIESGKSLLLNECGSYHILTDSIKILDTIVKEELTFPNSKYTEEDIKIIKWPNGSHYYAKIQHIDVYDQKTQTQKWDTHKEAYEFSLQFLKELNGE